MAQPLTIDNLENGSDYCVLPGRTHIYGNDYMKGEEGGLEIFFNKYSSTGRITKVEINEEIDCNKYNYYYTMRNSMPSGSMPRGFYAMKITGFVGCSNDEIKSVLKHNYDVYKVSRKNISAQGVLNGILGSNQKTDTPAVAQNNKSDVAPPTAGGRRSRNQRKSRKQRKSRRSRR